jgi:hypothetical protein
MKNSRSTWSSNPVPCYFNSMVYPVGQYLLCGSELLHCEERGVWVRKGEKRPE